MRVRAVITCECGFEVRAADEQGLVAEVRRHAAETHGMPLSHEDALLLVSRAELAAQPTTPGETTDRSDEEEK
jgi:predicted small metal-binding protein